MTTVWDVIDQAAAQRGVDPRLAEAIAYQESGGNPNAIGDQGTSFGLFQLHTPGGEGAGMTLAQLFDPLTNALRGLLTVGQVEHANPTADPGWIAATAQRPANQGAYASSVDAILSRITGGSLVLPHNASTPAIPGNGTVPTTSAAYSLISGLFGTGVGPNWGVDIPGAVGSVAGNAGNAVTGVGQGIAGVGAAILAFPGTAVHAIADFVASAIGAAVTDVELWLHKNLVAFAVAAVVTGILFAGGG